MLLVATRIRPPWSPRGRMGAAVYCLGPLDSNSALTSPLTTVPRSYTFHFSVVL